MGSMLSANPKTPILHHETTRKTNIPLRPIRILLRTHLLNADFQTAILGESHILLLHVFLAAVGELVAPQVDLVAEVGGGADDGEEDYEREEGGEAHGCCCLVVLCGEGLGWISRWWCLFGFVIRRGGMERRTGCGRRNE